MLGTSNADGTTPIPAYVDSATNRWLVSASFSGTTVSEYAEDAPHTSADLGVMALAVRQDTQVDFGADGDYVPLSIDADGALRVSGGGGPVHNMLQEPIKLLLRELWRWDMMGLRLSL